jgi:hypothetical protein
MNQLDLLKINVNDHTEKKNGLTYLSWAWAWAEVLKVDTAANYKIEMFVDVAGNPVPFLQFNNSCMVWVTVTVFGKALSCQLPVLDYRNKCIPQPNAFDVNTSIMRCLVKAIAMHGLGLYIYAGEDLPETDTALVIPVTPEVKKPVEKMKHVAVQPTEWDNSDESRTLFAEGMIQYTAICSSLADLSSYWASNKLQLVSLKETHPDLHARVLNKFSEIKKTFQG